MEAGFDGVEIHSANGYLHEQFLNPMVNDRDDRYSAKTLENRLRFTLEVVERIGAERTSIRPSPFGQLFDMPLHDQIEATYTALAQALGQRRLAYVHVMNQSNYQRLDGQAQAGEEEKFFDVLKAMKGHLPHTALILAGAMNRQRAEQMIAEGLIDLVGIGVDFISNPDLVARIKSNLPIAPADPASFHGGGAQGYIDYPPYR